MYLHKPMHQKKVTSIPPQRICIVLSPTSIFTQKYWVTKFHVHRDCAHFPLRFPHAYIGSRAGGSMAGAPMELLQKQSTKPSVNFCMRDFVTLYSCRDSNLAGDKCQYTPNMRISCAKWDFPWKILSIHPCPANRPIPFPLANKLIMETRLPWATVTDTRSTAEMKKSLWMSGIWAPSSA